MTIPATVNRRIPLSLTVLTPVAIGDGGTLSPLTDYIYEPAENPPEIILIDAAKLEKALTSPGLLDAFVRGVRPTANKDKSDFLRRFIEDSLDGDVLAFKKGPILRAFGLETPTEIGTIVKDVRQPYIPGSTIKGALKTALLYNWMLQGATGNTPELKFKEVLKTARNRKFVTDKYEALEQQLFGDVKAAQQQNLPLDFSRLKVQDAFGISEKKLAVYNTRRLRTRLSERSAGNIDAVTEAIDSGAHASFDLLIARNSLERFATEALQFLNTETAFSGLCSAINRFSLDFLEWDERQINNIRDDKLRGTFAGYMQFLYDLKTKIAQAGDHTAYLRLGSGKTYFNNSIGMTIENNGLLFETMRKLLKMGTEGQKIFPVTRRVTLPEHLPMGWVKLEMQE